MEPSQPIEQNTLGRVKLCHSRIPAHGSQTVASEIGTFRSSGALLSNNSSSIKKTTFVARVWQMQLYISHSDQKRARPVKEMFSPCRGKMCQASSGRRGGGGGGGGGRR